MKSSQSKMPTGSGARQGGAALQAGEAYLPLLEDFPNAALITDRRKKVVFLNRAATSLFGETLQLGDPCPICSQLTGMPLSVDGKVRHERCLQYGEALKDAPLLLKAGWSHP
jgi:hypothetical protein